MDELMIQLRDAQLNIKHQDRIIRSATGYVQLHENKGQIIVGNNDKTIIRGQGYRAANAVWGISLNAPARIEIPEGRLAINPYPIMDQVSNTISKVLIKKYGFGFNPAGVPVLISCTLMYDLSLKLATELSRLIYTTAKQDAKYGPEDDGPKLYGKYTSHNLLTDHELGTGFFIRLDGDYGVWGNMSEPRVCSLYTDHVSRKYSALQIADTLCDSLILRRHPGAVILSHELTGTQDNHILTLGVTGWAHDHTQAQIIDMVEKADEIARLAGNADRTIKIDGVEVAVDHTDATNKDVEDFDLGDDIEWESDIA